MKYRPHLIGIALGWIIGGPVVAVIGGLIGSVVQYFSESRFLISNKFSPKAGEQGDALMVIFAHILKADHHYSIEELRYIKKFLEKNYGEYLADEGIKYLKNLMKEDPNLKRACIRIKSTIPYADRKELLYYLFGIAGSDGELVVKELRIIHYIADQLGIISEDFDEAKGMYDREQKQKIQSTPNIPSKTDRAMKILGLEKEASATEIKKAYRTLAKKYHPDKVAYLGEEFLAGAEERFEELQEAYEYLKRTRGIV